MRELNLDQLRTLVAVADLGTFAAAAQALHLAPPTVSLHISELEAKLDARLLIRGSRQVIPTTSGAILVERGRQLLHDADDAMNAVRGQSSGFKGRVRLGATTGVVVELLPDVLEMLQERHPGIEVDLSILGSHEALARLNAGEIDIGLVIEPQTPLRGLEISPWRSQPVMAYVPQRWAAPAEITPAWLAERSLILNTPNTYLYQLTMGWFAAAGLSPRARIQLNYDAAARSLVSAGYGAALLPAHKPMDSPLNERVQILGLNPLLTRRLGIAHRSDGVLDRATLRLLEVLREFGGESM